MRTFLLAAALGLMAVSQLPAQPVTKKFGKGVITDVDGGPNAQKPNLPTTPLETNPFRFDVIQPTVTAMTMYPKDVKCRMLVDEKGRRWKQSGGQAMDFRPQQLDGWLITSIEGKQTFVTVTGKVFVMQ